VGDLVRQAHLADRLTDALSALPTTLEEQSANLDRLVGRIGLGVGEALLAFLLVAGALFEGPRMIADVRRAVPPVRRPEADEIGRTVYQVLARYFAGTLLVAIANGMWVALVAMVVGVPLSPVLGVWSALTAMIPQIGGLMGFALVLLVSITAGVGPAIAMSIAFLAFMLFSNHILVPTVVGRAVSLSAPVTMLAAIGGFSVAGVVGALFAVPTIGALKAVAMRLRYGAPDVDDEPAPHAPGRLARLRAKVLHRA
jgi:predicted PurR-regulated permease PerM